MSGQPLTEQEVRAEEGEAEAWFALCEATVRLAAAFADFDAARDEYARTRQKGMTVA